MAKKRDCCNDIESYRRMIENISSYRDMIKNLEDYKKMIEGMEEFEKMLELVEKYGIKTKAKRIPAMPWYEEPFETRIE